MQVYLLCMYVEAGVNEQAFIPQWIPCQGRAPPPQLNRVHTQYGRLHSQLGIMGVNEDRRSDRVVRL